MSFPLSRSRRAMRALAALLLLAASLPRIAAAQALYHVLEKGETLYSVARAYGVKPDAIARANAIDDPSRLRAGTKLLIPRASAGASASADAGDAQAALTHRVAKGDTLYSIAKAYGVRLDALLAANDLGAGSVIKAGRTLAIPAGGKAPDAAVTVTSPSPAAATAPTTAAPAMPDAVKTTARTVSAGLAWPCPGEILYLDGKAYGVVIRAKLGESLRAVASGTVSSAGPYRGYGNVVFVLSRGYIYVYGGNDSISVRAGDQVRAGQELGKVGMDAKQGGPAAYFLVFRNGAAVDPATAPRE